MEKKYEILIPSAVGIQHFQSGPSNSVGIGQSEEPLAQCRRPFRRAFAVLRSEGNELLHGAVWSVESIGRFGILSMGPCAWFTDRKAQVFVHRRSHEGLKSRLNPPQK